MMPLVPERLRAVMHSIQVASEGTQSKADIGESSSGPVGDGFRAYSGLWTDCWLYL